jgi:hypothetical protein
METTKTITPRDLEKICKTISLNTIVIYLDNYRFNKFRLTPYLKRKALYEVNLDFLNTFYTYLFYKNQYEAAENLKSEFKSKEIKAINM